MPGTLTLFQGRDCAPAISAALRKQHQRYRFQIIGSVIWSADPHQLLALRHGAEFSAGLLLEERKIEVTACTAFLQGLRLIGLHFKTDHWMLGLEPREPNGEIPAKEVERHSKTHESS